MNQEWKTEPEQQAGELPPFEEGALCPYPQTCEFDCYRLTGVPGCTRETCPYRIHARRIVARRIQELAALPERTAVQEERYQALKRRYARRIVQ